MALCFSRNYAVIKVDKFSEWHGSKTGSASKDSYRISRVSVCKDCDSKNENREPIERTSYARFLFFFFCLKWIIRWYSCWSFCSGLVSKENYSEFVSRSNVKLDRFTDLFLAVVSLPTLGYVVRVSFTFKSYVFWEKKFFFFIFHRIDIV